MNVDRLDALLQRFSVSARIFHSGPLCGVTDHVPEADFGQLHLIRRGPVDVHHSAKRRQRVEEPSLIFYPRPLPHRFVTDKVVGADMACANVSFNAGSTNPIAQALPDVIVMPLVDVENAGPVLDVLFREAFAQACGRRHIVNRLFEVVLILILRTLLNRAEVDHGLLAGLAHLKLAKALTAIHASPGKAWPLEDLAEIAGMSRSHFASTFHEVVGSTPGDYLTRYRISLAQDMLRRGEPVKMIAVHVGYGSTAALSRAFSAVSGKSPREWKAGLDAASV
ncbi:AraC-like DNA-binding protein [Povalibacter uvarum]|uniref:AraC-like DNA-binding protein n=1 Tax=Povalibacter uvarum TaxID=732238 RepID=A0A841HT91_9GAMM|nr:AraC family transcriptional regulator [Povalibacter uvarum]MBB6095519.1 AraC-like DNA-binding protein [Povalibacter uvarum]